MREIDLVGRPSHRAAWLGRLFVRDVQILVWVIVVAACLPFLCVRQRSLLGGLGAATTLLFQQLGATFIKIGQILSTRPDLFPPAFLAPLVALQDRVAQFSIAEAREAVAEELGRPLEDVFLDFSAAPVASASVAQVHRATLRAAHGGMPAGAVVAVKLRRPGIVRRAYLDEAILRALARLVALVPTFAMVSPVESMNHFCEAVNLQLDFRIEAENNRRFRQNFAGDAHVLFPALVDDLCTDRMLTMEFVDGVKDGALESVGCSRKFLGRKGIEIICRMIYQHGFVHADLHPGNILYLAGNRIALIDVGLVAVLDDDSRDAIARLNGNILMGRGEELARMIYERSPIKNVPNYAVYQRDVIEFVSRIHGRPLAELQITILIGELFNILRRHHIRAAADFTVVNIAMMVAEGLGKKLDPTLDLSVEALPYIQAVLAGTPLPAVAPPADEAISRAAPAPTAVPRRSG